MSFPWVLWIASMVHIGWGIGLIMHAQTSRLLVLLGNDRVLGIVGDPLYVGVLLILFSIFAIAGLSNESRLTRWQIVGFLFPQYALLILSFISDIILLYTQDIDNSTVHFWDLWVALVSILAISLAHTAAVIERYFVKWNTLFHLRV